MVKLTERYSIEKLRDCVCLITKVEAIEKKTKEAYLREEKRYYPHIRMALKWFVYNYVEDESENVEDIVIKVKEALTVLDNIKDELRIML